MTAVMVPMRGRPVGAERISGLCGAIAIAIAAAALLGWAASIEPLTRVAPSLPTMTPLAAVGFAGLGVALLLLRPASLTADRILGRWIGLSVAAVGAAVIGEYLFGAIGIDHLLFNVSDGLHPGRPSAHTAVGLVVAGLTLWSVDRDPPRHLPEAVGALAIWLVALVAVVGYAFRLNYLDGSNATDGMAVLSVVGLLTVAAGATTLRPDRGAAAYLISRDPGAQVARTLIPAAVLAPLALGFARLEAQRQGLFGSEVGLAITTLCSTAILLGVIWLSATRLSASDTRRRDAEKSRQMLDSVASKLPVAFYQAEPGEHGRWRYVAPQIERMFGFPAEEWIVDRDLWARLLHPEDRMQVLRHEREIWEGHGPGTTGVIEYRMLTRGGDTIWVRDEGVVGDDGFLDGVLVDITSRRAAEERFKRLLEAAPDPMVIVGADGVIKLVNHQVENVLGYERHELVGAPVEVLVPQQLRNRHVGHRTGFVGDAKTRPMGTGLDLNVRCKDGSEIPVEISLSPMESDEGLLVIAAIRDVTAQRKAENALRHLAEHDPLTGLHNRRRFEEELERAVAAAARYRTPAALLILDLDEFKEVNDALGHAAGDTLLVGVADALQKRLRETDALARLGGDEFAVVLSHVGSDEARTVAEALLETIRSQMRVEAMPDATITASIGIALVEPGSPASAEALLSRADIAMYEAKRTGRDRHAVYGDESEFKPRLSPHAASRAREPRPAA